MGFQQASFLGSGKLQECFSRAGIELPVAPYENVSLPGAPDQRTSSASIARNFAEISPFGTFISFKRLT